MSTDKTFPALSTHPSTIIASNPHLNRLEIGAIIIRKSDSKLLRKLWEIPGSRWKSEKENGATLRDVVVQRVREQTGLEYGVVRMVEEWIEFRDRSSGEICRKFTVFANVEEAREAVLLVPEEHTEYRWVRLRQAQLERLEFTRPDVR